MTTLNDRLDDLAGAAPTELPEGDLWSRGRRLLWRRRAASGVVTGLLVLGVGSLSTLVVDEMSRPTPAAPTPSATLGLPDRIYAPSPWTSSTDDDGPIGPLVAIVAAERKTFWSSSPGLVAVSAAGDYRFLDLPDRADVAVFGAKPALSADGRWVAYLVTGPTTGEPNPYNGDVVGGVGVYDTVTGEDQRELIPSVHGLDVQDLTWVGDSVLANVGAYTRFQGDSSGNSSSSKGVGLLSWDLVDGSRRLSAPGTLPLSAALPAGDGSSIMDNGRLSFLSGDGSTRRGPVLDFDVKDGLVAVSPDGRRAAALEDLDGLAVDDSATPPSPLRVQSIAGAAPSVVVPDATGRELIGWRDDDHVIVLDRARGCYESIDVTSGRTEPVLTLPDAAVSPVVIVAADALTGPSFVAPEPGARPSPRLMAGLGVAVSVLLVVVLLVLRRRRVRR